MAFPDCNVRFDGGFVIVFVDAGNGVGGNCNSGKRKSRSRKRSVIWVNSYVKPRSSAYLDKNSYKEYFLIVLLTSLK